MNAQRRNVLRPTERWLWQRRATRLGVGAGGDELLLELREDGDHHRRELLQAQLLRAIPVKALEDLTRLLLIHGAVFQGGAEHRLALLGGLLLWRFFGLLLALLALLVLLAVGRELLHRHGPLRLLWGEPLDVGAVGALAVELLLVALAPRLRLELLRLQLPPLLALHQPLLLQRFSKLRLRLVPERPARRDECEDVRVGVRGGEVQRQGAVVVAVVECLGPADDLRAADIGQAIRLGGDDELQHIEVGIRARGVVHPRARMHNKFVTKCKYGWLLVRTAGRPWRRAC